MKSKRFTTCLLVVGAVVVPGGTTTADEPVEPPVEGPIEEPADDDAIEPADEPDAVPLVAVGAPPVPPGPQVAVGAPPVPDVAPSSFGARPPTPVAHAIGAITRRDADDRAAAAKAAADEIAALIARLVR